MPTPTNLTAATATDISALPYSATQDVFDAGITHPVWFTFLAPRDGTLRLFPFGYADPTSCNTTSVYRPFTRTFLGPASAPVQTIPGEAWNTTLFIPVTAGLRYYFSVSPTPFGSPAVNPSPAVLTLQADFFADTPRPYAAGNYFIPPDSEGFPAAVVEAGTGKVLQLIKFPNGEGGAQLPSGVMLLEDSSQRTSGQTRAILYDSQINQLAVINWDTSADGWYDSYMGSNKRDTFYVGYNTDYVNFSGNASFRTVSATGVASGWTELAVAGLRGLAPSNDGTTLYYTISDGANRQVKRWSLTGGGALSDFAPNYTPGGNLYHAHDVLVLDDDTVLVAYTFDYESGGVLWTDAVVVRYNASGTVINTYPFGNDANTGVRIAYNYADPTTFVVYQHDDRETGPFDCLGRGGGTVQLDVVRVADGVTVSNTPAVWTSGGKFIGPESATRSDYGPSGSCPIVRLVTALAPVVEVPPTPRPVLLDNSIPCCDHAPVGPGVPVQPTPPFILPGWQAHCVGGGAVAQVADLVESESWIR